LLNLCKVVFIHITFKKVITMERTLVAVFDDQSDAQQAQEALIDSGFSSNTVRLTFADRANQATAVEPKPEESIGDKIANFFGFGDHDETYSEAIRRGGYVLTVNADSDEDCDRAQDIIEEYEPVDIDEREAEWRDGGWQASDESKSRSREELSQVGNYPSRRPGVRVLSRFTAEPVGNVPQSDIHPYTGPERRRASNDDYHGLERRAA
jgi:hypothetical protein